MSNYCLGPLYTMYVTIKKPVDVNVPALLLGRQALRSAHEFIICYMVCSPSSMPRFQALCSRAFVETLPRAWRSYPRVARIAASCRQRNVWRKMLICAGICRNKRVRVWRWRERKTQHGPAVSGTADLPRCSTRGTGSV